MKMNTLRVLAASAGIILFAANGAHAETFRDDARHFSLELPDGWGPMTPETLATVNNLVRDRMGPKTQYSTGFQPKSAPPLAYPYILVQIQPGRTEGMSFEQLEHELSKSLPGELKQVEGKLSDIGSNLLVNTPVIDRAGRRILLRVKMDVARVGPVSGISFGMIGREGYVFLHCYAREAEFAERLPQYNAIADSFRFDPGFEYVPYSAPLRRGPFLWWADLGGGLVGGILGAAFAGAVTLLFWLFRRLARTFRGAQ